MEKNPRPAYLCLIALLAGLGTASAWGASDEVNFTYYIRFSSGGLGNIYGIAKAPTQWFLIRGTQTYNLDDFVRSGKFCEIYGHRWEGEFDLRVIYHYGHVGYDFYNCSLCHHRRKKIKQKKEIEEWEK